MNYQTLKKKFQKTPLIFSKDITRTSQNPQSIRNQLTRWHKNGLIVKLRRGVFLLNQDDCKTQVDKNFIANHLYTPSYLSLEYALAFYGLIPERVLSVTCVTTSKTMRFKNKVGTFIYQHIKPEAFCGFKEVKQDNFSFLIALPEKAVVDFLYLNLSKFNKDFKNMLKYSYRFQNLEELNPDRLIEFTELFGSRKLIRLVGQFCDLVGEEKK